MLNKLMFFLITIFSLVGYVGYQISVCKIYLPGVPDSALTYIDGIAYLTGQLDPYTGTAYATVCGGECGLWCPRLHWRAEFKGGKYHGEFDAPLTGVGDSHWFSPGDETKTYIYQAGQRVK